MYYKGSPYYVITKNKSNIINFKLVFSIKLQIPPVITLGI